MILILDGDDGVRDSLRLLLECAGFEALEFASCREFLDVDRSGDGDCLILDLHMPEMSGIELLEEMRRRGKTLPAILITERLDSTLGSVSTWFGRPWVRRKSRPFDRDCLPTGISGTMSPGIMNDVARVRRLAGSVFLAIG